MSPRQRNLCIDQVIPQSTFSNKAVHPGVLPRSLSSQLARLAAGFSNRPVHLGELFTVLQTRGIDALLLVLAFPFVTPMPLPGFSTVFGLLIALLGAGMVVGHNPRLPRRFNSRVLPANFLPKLLMAASAGFGRLERILKPRFLYPAFPVAFQRASGVIICICGLLLLLPLPVPFSNGFPALTIILLAAAGLQRDGAVFAAGCLQFVFCLGFFAALGFGGCEAWQRFSTEE